tara:strand:+ start:217461 stop:217889 length:429 start_codon:yes stop_codon:yes gene_type:complete
MAVYRETPKCPFCDEIIAKGQYLPPNDNMICGDSFIGWEWLEHDCKSGIDLTEDQKEKLGEISVQIENDNIRKEQIKIQNKKNNLKDLILANVGDLASDLLYYDRKEDEELSVGDIERAIEDGVITLDEIVDKFKNEFKTFT